MSPEGPLYGDHLEDSIRGSQAPSLADWQADCPQYSYYRRGQFDGPRPSRGNLMQTFQQFAVGPLCLSLQSGNYLESISQSGI